MSFSALIIESLVSAGGYFLASCAFALCYLTRRDGLFHLAQGGIVIVSIGLFNRLMGSGVGLPIAIPLAVIAGVATGLAVEVIVYRPLRRRSLGSDIFLLSSLGALIVLQRGTSIVLGAAPLGLERHKEIGQRFAVLGGQLTAVDIATLFVAGTIAVLFGVTYSGSLGRGITAVRQSELVYDWRGGNSRWVLIVVAATSGGLAALAGILHHLDHRFVINTGGIGHMLPVIVVVLMAASLTGVAMRRLDVTARTSRAERTTFVAFMLLGSGLLAIVKHVSAVYADPRWTNSLFLAIAILSLVSFAGRRLGAESSAS